MSTHFYVYLLLDPRRNYLPFYVGKGKGLRAHQHLKSEAHAKVNKFKMNVIQKIRDTGLEPIISIWADNLSESEAFEIEMTLISRFGRRDIKTGILTNLSQGGEGNHGRKFTEEHQRKISEALKNRKTSDATKKKISERRRGQKASEATKQKLSIARKGKRCGQANPMFGRSGVNHPNYGKEGPSGEKNGMFGRKHSPDAIEKMKQKARERELLKRNLST
jgi:hypothetical protein